MQTFNHSKTYRYTESGAPEKANHLIIALHGYGQLPEFFIRKFSTLNQDHYVVCPEGPHRFYLKGTSGRVGASWMTKEARLDDIEDNNNWLTGLLEQLTKSNSFDKITLLGFSQGAATAARWHEKRRIAYNFVLWAGVFPPDLELPLESNAFSSSKNFFLVGDEDEYFSTAKIEAMRHQLRERKLEFEFIPFSGKHDITPDALEKLLPKLVE